MKKHIVKTGLLCAVGFFVFALSLNAQGTRQYSYDQISQDIVVNQDSTFTVRETQTYNFQGEYHKGWRSIPYNKISAITDVKVYEANGQPVIYSSRSLEKTDPLSWGKYTYYKSGGNMNIEWYYDVKDATRTWILEYKVHGGLSFLKNKDELYWNLLTDYDVPVKFVNAKVTIPGNTYSPSDHQTQIYVANAETAIHEVANNRTFIFSAENVEPYGKVTIAVGWPKGLVDESAFWKDWLKTNWALIADIMIVLATIISAIIYWYLTEKRGKGRGTIVPEYEPPKNLPPAMAEVIIHERVTPKGWSATVIDLAVKGYIKIEEEVSRKWSAVVIKIVLLVPVVVAGVTLSGMFASGNVGPQFWFVIIILIPIVIFILRSKKDFSPKDYILKSVKNYHSDLGLQDYEKYFLDNILSGGHFSTKEMKSDHIKSRALYMKMQKLEKSLYKETEIDTGAFEKPVSKDKFVILAFVVMIFSSAIGIGMATNLGTQSFLIVLAGCALSFWLFTKFEARLSAEGAILKEEWLGFKLYLQTAEKYRMQNLTPETFEKYLPYAIIFGVEKQWGKAFEGISMPPPGWYNGACAGSIGPISVGGSGGFSSGFSASAFSASFASSFTSAFSSSGGGGASGGGGGAGGGGGGGGGGAS